MRKHLDRSEYYESQDLQTSAHFELRSYQSAPNLVTVDEEPQRSVAEPDQPGRESEEQAMIRTSPDDRDGSITGVIRKMEQLLISLSASRAEHF